jgi:isoquinoline 1-oxidoreductase subunit beta
MNRRDFIYSSALAGGGLTLSFQIFGQQITAAKAPSAGPVPLGDFIRITPDGDVLFQFIKHEMGQGVSTSMAQILCEELDADWNKVKIEFPIVDLPRYENEKNGGYGTGGSCTLIYTYDLLRKAGATARQMLISAAAREWNTSTEQCYAQNHWVIHRPSSRKLSFGELASEAAQLAVPDNPPLKERRAFSTIGKPKAAKLNSLIGTGQMKYGLDVKVPGMLYALVARCPVFKGKLKEYDATDALKVPGVKKVFTTQPIAGPQFTRHLPHDIREGVVVVGDSFWAARKARDALKIEWDEGINGRYSTEDFERLAAERAMHRTDPTGFIGDENAISNMAHVRKTLRASYIYPHQLHSCMEPLNCTAHVREDACDVWVGTQDAMLVMEELRKLLRLPEERIKLHLFPSGGGFGRRAYSDLAVEAAFISKQAGYLPVKMLWTREDDQQCNLAHLFQHLEYQAALNGANEVYALYEKEIRTYTWAEKYANPSLPRMAYDIPNLRYDFEDLSKAELIQSSAWRGVDVHGRALSECFMDEIAAEVKADPYAFRLSLLKPGRNVHVGGEHPVSSDRMRGVLEVAAQKAGWGKTMESGRGMGIALIPYANTCCAAVAEVTVRAGTLTIDKITAAIDCGKVINPSGANNQIVGGIVWSLTALLYGGAPIKNGWLQHSNFHQNKLLRMNECPPIDVHFVEREDDRPWGLGEMSAPLGVPAVLNAIYAATGKRIRRIPLRNEDLVTG